MYCPHCGNTARVIDSRNEANKKGYRVEKQTVQRKRRCIQCLHIFTTTERIDNAKG